MELLRPGVLDGLRIVVAGPDGGGGELGSAVAERAAALGASVAPLRLDPHGPEEEAMAAGSDAATPGSSTAAGRDSSAAATPAVLVWDGDAALARAAGVDGVRAALDGAWLAIRAVAVPAWTGDGHGSGGRILLLAPRPGDAHAEAARAGLENLARTLSIEWARFGIRPVAVLPGGRTPADEVAELAAYLASPAGGYYAGCAFTLGATEG